MKTYFRYILVLTFAVFPVTGCNLEEEVFSELTEDTLFSSDSGITTIINEAYANAHLPYYGGGGARFYFSAMTSGESWNEGGGVANLLTPLTNFTFDSSLIWFNNYWEIAYRAIRDANLLIDKLNDENDPNGILKGEVQFIRAISYYHLNNAFGAVPLYQTPDDDLFLVKSASQDVKDFIENDLINAAAVLPNKQNVYGRATKGAALGLLCKLYLNFKDWEKSATIAREIIASGDYSLQENYADAFSLANEGNNELLWVLTRTANGAVGNTGAAQYINAHTFPTDFPLLPNQSVYAAKTYFFDVFVNSFEPGDTRRDMIITEYTNINGEFIQLLGSNKSLSLKYEFDPNANGPGGGNDFPVVRYSDILLSLSEALNEINGPNQESIDLINQVRNRAGASSLSLGSFPSKEALRDKIMQERELEFYAEALSREDQIRAGTFIEKATARGKIVDTHHLLFPIPLSEISRNPNLEQNPGY
ncbi:MAG: RagB/SusD family nutrient uptake outer membrane protein [Flavobacteriaceae bacterium]